MNTLQLPPMKTSYLLSLALAIGSLIGPAIAIYLVLVLVSLGTAKLKFDLRDGSEIIGAFLSCHITRLKAKGDDVAKSCRIWVLADDDYYREVILSDVVSISVVEI
jgi:hypothetical protein